MLLDDYGLSYDQIEKALDAIIHNHGQENIAAAKRVEFVLDRYADKRLSVHGWIYPTQPGLHQCKSKYCRIRRDCRGRKRVSGRDRRSAGDGGKDGAEWTAGSRAGRRRI